MLHTPEHRIDHFSVSGTATLPKNPSLNEAMEGLRAVIGALVGEDNPTSSRLSDYSEHQEEVAACISRNEGLYLQTLRDVVAQIIVDGVCLWDRASHQNPEYSTAENPKWQAAKEAFEAIPDPWVPESRNSPLNRGSLQDISESGPSVLPTTPPKELLNGLNLSLLEFAEKILVLYQCGFINTENNVSGRWSLLEYTEDRENPTLLEDVRIWGTSVIQGFVMIREGSKVSLKFKTSCHAAKEGQNYYTLNEESKLVSCESFEKRNRFKAIFHLRMEASIYFSDQSPLACFEVWIESTHVDFLYRGPRTNEIKRLENCDNLEKLKIASPVFPRRAIEGERRLSSQESGIVSIPTRVQTQMPLSIAKQLGSDPERSVEQRHAIGERNALGSPRSIDSDDPPATTEKSPLLGPNGEPRASYATDSATPSPVPRERRGSAVRSVSFSPDSPVRNSQMGRLPVFNSSSSEPGNSESPQSDSGLLARRELPYRHSPPSRNRSPLIFSKHFPENSALPGLRLAGQSVATPPEESGTEGDSEHEAPDSPPPAWAFPGRGGGHSSRPRRGHYGS